MDLQGKANGARIELSEPLPYPDGTPLHVTVEPARSESNGQTPQPGSIDAILSVAGTFSEADAEEILTGALECRQIDPELWK